MLYAKGAPDLEKGEPVQESSVEQITNMSEFNKAMASSDSCIIKFSTNWCPACKGMLDDFESVASESDISFYNVDCDLSGNKELCKQMNITAYPTILTKQIVMTQGSLSKSALQKTAQLLQGVMPEPSATKPSEIKDEKPYRAMQKDKKRRYKKRWGNRYGQRKESQVNEKSGIADLKPVAE